MEVYFAPFTEADMRYCAPVNPDQDEAVSSIPPLGKFFREIWAEEDHVDIRQAKGDAQAEEESEKGVGCGDLTARILAALIEEKVIPSPPAEVNGKNPSENGSPSLDKLFNYNHVDSVPLPPDAPPTYDYSPQAMLTLEERIKMELRSIGLLDDGDTGIDGAQREDDEICSEMRKLQKQLRDQIMANNEIRARLYSILSPILAREEAEKKRKSCKCCSGKVIFETYEKEEEKANFKERHHMKAIKKIDCFGTKGSTSRLPLFTASLTWSP